MDDETRKYGMRLKLIYSLCGLLLGAVCILSGCALFLSGVVGSTTWTFKAMGVAESTITDAAPGVVLFIVGLFFVIFTRFRVVEDSETIEVIEPPPKSGEGAVRRRFVPGVA